MSGCSVDLTLWGVFCNKDGLQQNSTSNFFPMIAIKAGRISDFNRRSISTTFTSQLSINPDIKESHDLKTWFEKEGQPLNLTPYLHMVPLVVTPLFRKQ
jgi:replication factor A1